MSDPVFTVRYVGSLPEYQGHVACATMDGEWTGPETTRYALRMWDTEAVLYNARHRSLEFGGVTMWGPELGPCICRCGLDHDRAPKALVTTP